MIRLMGSRPNRLEAIGRQVLADRVYQSIFASVVDGRLEAGASLSIDGLARDLKVSPTPVREALARMEATGMVLRVALKGYRVAPLFTTSDLAELMDARLVIEPVNAERACQRTTPELNDALEQAIADLRIAPHGAAFADFRDSWQADERFHRLIAEAGANTFILAAYHSLGGQIQRFRYFGRLGPLDAEHAVKEHTAILAAFRAADPERAREAMVAHICGVKERSSKDAVEGA